MRENNLIGLSWNKLKVGNPSKEDNWYRDRDGRAPAGRCMELAGAAPVSSSTLDADKEMCAQRGMKNVHGAFLVLPYAKTFSKLMLLNLRG